MPVAARRIPLYFEFEMGTIEAEQRATMDKSNCTGSMTGKHAKKLALASTLDNSLSLDVNIFVFVMCFVCILSGFEPKISHCCDWGGWYTHIKSIIHLPDTFTPQNASQPREGQSTSLNFRLFEFISIPVSPSLDIQIFFLHPNPNSNTHYTVYNQISDSSQEVT